MANIGTPLRIINVPEPIRAPQIIPQSTPVKVPQEVGV